MCKLYRSKKGVTLLETVLYLALLSIIISIFCLNLNYFENRKKDIEIDKELLLIKEFIIKKQLEAINTSNSTKIYIDLENDIISREFKGKENIKLEVLDIVDTRNSREYMITSNGEFDKDLYIKLKNYKGDEYVFKYRSDQKQIEIKR